MKKINFFLFFLDLQNIETKVFRSFKICLQFIINYMTEMQQIGKNRRSYLQNNEFLQRRRHQQQLQYFMENSSLSSAEKQKIQKFGDLTPKFYMFSKTIERHQVCQNKIKLLKSLKSEQWSPRICGFLSIFIVYYQNLSEIYKKHDQYHKRQNSYVSKEYAKERYQLRKKMLFGTVQQNKWLVKKILQKMHEEKREEGQRLGRSRQKKQRQLKLTDFF